MEEKLAIDELKKRLNEEIELNNTLTSCEILEISRELDKLIVEYQKKQIMNPYSYADK